MCKTTRNPPLPTCVNVILVIRLSTSMRAAGLSLSRCVPLPGALFFAPGTCRRGGGVAGTSVLEALCSQRIRGGVAARIDTHDMVNVMFRHVTRRLLLL